MEIGRIPPVPPPSQNDRQTVPQQAAADRANAPAQPQEHKKVPFDPAPAIRPTLQDRIDFNRTLLALRRF